MGAALKPVHCSFAIAHAADMNDYGGLSSAYRIQRSCDELLAGNTLARVEIECLVHTAEAATAEQLALPTAQTAARQ